ncbi:hypothetical protein FY036_17000 [Mesorhizobium microcysteis]|uniref:Phosphohydrolase n=1 Tax=Neoaquamicrobium microcysteis TaxID=2682781 RepID=A0A5D4GT83_9HYPH|nr:hypothetical protein [Mesorhizobium microcysteis]TYR31123.1 hypothetical protein FY036_17000 [Mesorhizobium microcysteis]
MFARLATIETELRRRLAEPHRHYHTQQHIDTLLAMLEAKLPDLHHPEASELAIWFHDAVYDPAARDNERKSASLMREMLSGIIDPELIDIAEIMILATETHRVPPALPIDIATDTALFLDLDMAILAAAASTYDVYADGVRREFVPVVGETAYVTGRLDFLTKTLGSGRPLFCTEWGRSMEAAARENVERERAALSSELSP